MILTECAKNSPYFVGMKPRCCYLKISTPWPCLSPYPTAPPPPGHVLSWCFNFHSNGLKSVNTIQIIPYQGNPQEWVIKTTSTPWCGRGLDWIQYPLVLSSSNGTLVSQNKCYSYSYYIYVPIISLQEMIHRLLKHASTPADKVSSMADKFTLYSGHDNTLTPLLLALGMKIEHWPPFASR